MIKHIEAIRLSNRIQKQTCREEVEEGRESSSMEKKPEMPVRQTQEDHQGGRESSSSSSMGKRKLSTEAGQPDQEDHGEGDQSPSSMEIKKQKVDRPDQENSSTMENKKLEVDPVRPLHHQPQRLEYPKGFRFLPTEVELVRDYLMKKFNKEDVPVPINEIQEDEVYKYSPMQLAGVGKHIIDGDKRLGVKTLFEYKGSNSEWEMKEYALTDLEKSEAKLLNGFVLCYIYEKEEDAEEKFEDIIVNNEELVPPSPTPMISTSTEEYFKSFPSGVLFSPTDKELVIYYLWVKNKFDGRHLPINRIHEVEIYKYHPQRLTEMHERCREDGWYFFVPKHKKENQLKSSDAGGYWKLEQESHEPPLQRNIDSSSTVKCHKTSFRYYEDQKQPARDRTVWKMIEYSIRIPDAEDDDSGTGKPYWDLCKIRSFKSWEIKKPRKKSTDDQKGKGRHIQLLDLNEDPPEESAEDAR
ncbi:hypothetical protein FNV43_RR16459 [Rhamnella rubrinervis]|uniref:NAC domain-containing protein n=1 Tax=Rhamnella rubrinervis TaxID=2594499 RepID=A0A8K0GYV3_9ROSA|nr:hypothetical protein FNV43_RR16459 [Rhamnella rubrinervis]